MRRHHIEELLIGGVVSVALLGGASMIGATAGDIEHAWAVEDLTRAGWVPESEEHIAVWAREAAYCDDACPRWVRETLDRAFVNWRNIDW